jgi:spermidine synthase
MLFLPSPKSALILGGGSLFAAAEILKYPTIRRVVMVDHDPDVVAMCVRRYRHARDCIRDRRLSMVHADGMRFLRSVEEQFDFIVNDAVDLLSLPRSQLRSQFERLAEPLSPDGVCSDLVYRHVFDRRRVDATIRHLSSFRFAMSLVFVPEYPGILHLLAMWGRSSRIRQSLDQSVNHCHARWLRSRSSSPCKYFDPRFVKHHLYLPPFVRRRLGPSES